MRDPVENVESWQVVQGGVEEKKGEVEKVGESERPLDGRGPGTCCGGPGECLRLSGEVAGVAPRQRPPAEAKIGFA